MLINAHKLQNSSYTKLKFSQSENEIFLNYIVIQYNLKYSLLQIAQGVFL